MKDERNNSGEELVLWSERDTLVNMKVYTIMTSVMKNLFCFT